MRLRTKIFLTIVAAVLYWIAVQRFSSDHAAINVDPLKCEGLELWYRQYNDQYFGNLLPKDTVVDYSEHDDVMATTSMLPDGRFHIAFNDKYTSASRVAHLILLHEQCHIVAWSELDPATHNHGPHWRACMLTLDFEGAFRAQLIDGYTQP